MFQIPLKSNRLPSTRKTERNPTSYIERIKSLKSDEGGWEYNGKLSVLTGIEDIENYLE